MKPPLNLGRQWYNIVCWLNNYLYGLKQASQNWFRKFTSEVQNFGFKQSRADYSLFTKFQDDSFTAILLYVDEMVKTTNNEKAIKDLKRFLSTCFKIKDLEPLKDFLGVEVSWSKDGIAINQWKYALDIVEEAGLLRAKPAKFLME